MHNLFGFSTLDAANPTNLLPTTTMMAPNATETTTIIDMLVNEVKLVPNLKNINREIVNQ